eukprot:941021-Amorphochlora_amoeboformis.AAC.1
MEGKRHRSQENKKCQENDRPSHQKHHQTQGNMLPLVVIVKLLKARHPGDCWRLSQPVLTGATQDYPILLGSNGAFHSPEYLENFLEDP